MDTLTCITTHLGEHKLHLRVNILNAILDSEITCLHLFIYLLQALLQCHTVIVREQTDRVKHLHMSHIAQHVSLRQKQIQLTVTTYGKLLYKLIGRVTLIPKFHILLFFNFQSIQQSII